MNTQISKNTCSVAGCQKVKKSRGMCSAHYERWRRRNREAVEPQKGKWDNADGTRKTCTYPGCSKPIETVGFCKKHYHQFQYEATRGLTKSRKNRKKRDLDGNPLDLRCTFPGCDLPDFNPGLCAGHYYQRLRGEDLTPLREMRECPVNGCGGRFSVKLSRSGVCRRCSSTARRFSLSPEQLIALFSDNICSNPGCGETEGLHIDHDHSCCPRGAVKKESARSSCGKCVRGLLCRNCNLALGQLEESKPRILGLLEYLETRK